IAAMAGMCLGGAVFGVPIVLDGYISVAGALCASLINADCTAYLLASHISAEPAAWKVLRNLPLEPVIQAGMCLGEGTGAVAAMPLLEMGLQVYRKMGTFDDIHVEQYEVLDGKDER
ncbi:MAG: nicotinate-nucleotide--dimethylbenzimidazole phosphoribosyltransferase, partial [Coprococcus comes]|nr:nicotinate-nucleotide--dimethylbenzimidazole phosphoribosyltransferase [Coprococcus comes]